jgi:hypothetical protein
MSLDAHNRQEAILLQLYSVFVQPKTQPTQDQLSTNALKLRGRGQEGHVDIVVHCFCASQDAADAGPTPDQGSYVTGGAPLSS